jgi:hypothetical protein
MIDTWLCSAQCLVAAQARATGSGFFLHNCGYAHIYIHTQTHIHTNTCSYTRTHTTHTITQHTHNTHAHTCLCSIKRTQSLAPQRALPPNQQQEEAKEDRGSAGRQQEDASTSRWSASVWGILNEGSYIAGVLSSCRCPYNC